mmetsp:Transcript_91181/g.209035  ORF Transcript_91181/g.209035 Transcript_91181/m.209035 type:complete len:124 (+) Transcript_91181:188-559(+)
MPHRVWCTVRRQGRAILAKSHRSKQGEDDFGNELIQADYGHIGGPLYLAMYNKQKGIAGVDARITSWVSQMGIPGASGAGDLLRGAIEQRGSGALLCADQGVPADLGCGVGFREGGCCSAMAW